MSQSLSHATFVVRRSDDRGFSDDELIESHHTLSFGSYHDPRFVQFGSLRVFNEDSMALRFGFSGHSHRDVEIITYMLDGGLIVSHSGHLEAMSRGDAQLITAGTGMSHEVRSEHPTELAKLLQAWVVPWKKDLPPARVRITTFEASKRLGFVSFISPLKAGPEATHEEELAGVPAIAHSVAIHADVFAAAAIVSSGGSTEWVVGAGHATKKQRRNVFVHLPASDEGTSSIRLPQAASSGLVLEEGDGAFVSGVNDGDRLVVESVGDTDAEVFLIDSD